MSKKTDTMTNMNNYIDNQCLPHVWLRIYPIKLVYTCVSAWCTYVTLVYVYMCPSAHEYVRVLQEVCQGSENISTPMGVICIRMDTVVSQIFLPNICLCIYTIVI